MNKVRIIPPSTLMGFRWSRGGTPRWREAVHANQSSSLRPYMIDPIASQERLSSRGGRHPGSETWAYALFGEGL